MQREDVEGQLFVQTRILSVRVDELNILSEDLYFFVCIRMTTIRRWYGYSALSNVFFNIDPMIH